MSVLKKNWGFSLLPTYEIVLTLYGPGADYDAQNGIIQLQTTPDGDFKRATNHELLFHEIVHIGVEEAIVEKYELSHWEKERLVDLICARYLNELLPEYQLQTRGDARIDAFVDEWSIVHDLPAAIERFVQSYPRE